MMAARANNIICYVITGEDGEVIPPNATHVSVHPSVKIIPRRLFYRHEYIVELICHDGVIKIEEEAFHDCPCLKRVIMKGVEEVESRAFGWCRVLEYVECNKLAIIGEAAFSSCYSIKNINLPSAMVISPGVFSGCHKLKYAKFGKRLESFGYGAFYNCIHLEQITIPLKNGLLDKNSYGMNETFLICWNLKHIDLVEGVALQSTIHALLCDKWRDDMLAEIDSINEILPNIDAGDNVEDIEYYEEKCEEFNPGEITNVIREWIAKVLGKIVHYKAEHRRLLKGATTSLKHLLPDDIMMNNVVPFLTLPRHVFDGEDEDEETELETEENVDEPQNYQVDEEEDNTEGGDYGDEVIDTGREEEEVIDDGERNTKRRKTTNDDDADSGMINV